MAALSHLGTSLKKASKIGHPKTHYVRWNEPNKLLQNMKALCLQCEEFRNATIQILVIIKIKYKI
jgi:hypothetical protein